MAQVEIPLNVLKLWFWMLEDSGEPNLASQAEDALLSLFSDIESAKNYLLARQA